MELLQRVAEFLSTGLQNLASDSSEVLRLVWN